jgi:hypothetical protein
MIIAATGHRQDRETRTTGDAYLYRVTQYYDYWPFPHDSRVPAGSKSRKRAETFKTLEPVMRRLARANGYAKYQRRNGADWSAFVAVTEQLTHDGWQPLDLDFPPPRPAAPGTGDAASTEEDSTELAGAA